MKKITGLLIILLICAVFTVPAMANTFRDGNVISSGTYDTIKIMSNSNVTIDGNVEITGDLVIESGGTLTIRSGGSLSGKQIRYIQYLQNPKIILEPQSKIQIEFFAEAHAASFRRVLDESGIAYSKDSKTITAENNDPCQHKHIKVQTIRTCADCGAEISNNTASTLSDGNLTIVCTIVALVLGLGGGFFVGRKKNPTPANVIGNNEE